MRWDSERWIKLYTKDTTRWLRMTLEARCFFYEIMRQVDRGGEYTDAAQSGESVASSLAFRLHGDERKIESWLAELATDGCIKIDDRNVLSIPNFVAAQEARTNTAERARRYREKQEAADTSADPRHTSSHVVTASNDKTEEKEQNRKKEQRAQSAKPQAAIAPAVIEIQTNKRDAPYPVTQQQIDEWRGAFPAVDVLQELRKMAAWSVANPTRRKTVRGTPAFIFKWLAKEQDKPHPAQSAQTVTDYRPPQTPEYKAHAKLLTKHVGVLDDVCAKWGIDRRAAYALTGDEAKRFEAVLEETHEHRENARLGIVQ